MSKFNLKNINKTVNKSGNVAYKMDDKERLIAEVLTSFFNENKFYGDNSNKIVEDIRKIAINDSRFLANLTLYTRKEMHLRSISHVLAGELSKSVEGKKYAKEVIKNIVERPDDMNEILAYYLNTFGKPIPNGMKKGLAESFLKFNEYSLAKNNKKGEVKLKDILCLTHPKAKNEEQNELFKRILEDRMKTPETWETILSAKGNNAETWGYLIENNLVGYMALLRNLRNIVNAKPYNMDKVFEIIRSEERVRKSKQLPFRFYSAYKSIKDDKICEEKAYEALEDAIKHSVKNIKKLKGRTLIAADVSGSMNFTISYRSNIKCSEIAVVMLAIANYICEDAITVTFDDSLVLYDLDKDKGILKNAESIYVGGGWTDLTLPIKYLLNQKIKVDRIIMLSDNEINAGYSRTCQAWVDKYRKDINPDLWVHSIDMQGYGTQQFIGEKTNILAGWDEKVLEFIPRVEEGIGSLKDEIENYYFKEDYCKNIAQ